MSAGDLLAALADAGITVSRVGDDLKVRGAPGVALAPHLDRIRAHKRELLRELLQRAIRDALDVERKDFDQQHYAALCQRWNAETALEETAR
jgi:hypothetical protein